jgi:hypothetical protein
MLIKMSTNLWRGLNRLLNIALIIFLFPTTPWVKKLKTNSTLSRKSLTEGIKNYQVAKLRPFTKSYGLVILSLRPHGKMPENSPVIPSSKKISNSSIKSEKPS